MRRVAIILPAFNEAKRIGHVLENLKKQLRKKPSWAKGLKFTIIVVDDGSYDNTAKVAEKYRVIVLRHVINRGAGAAFKTGAEYAKQFADFFVSIDADGQHNPKEIFRVLEPVIKGKADICIGSRFLKRAKIPLIKRVGNYGLNLLTKVLYGIDCSDTQSGFRSYNKRAIERIKLTIDRYGFLTEMLAEIERNNLKIVEVPITVRQIAKKGTTVMDGLKIALDLFARR